jgi:hypothetical protein
VPYEWKSKMACVAVYKTLEREDRMDQFETLFNPFGESGAMKIEDLAYYPNAASSPVRKRASKHFAGRFLKFLMQDYDVKKERPSASLQALFKDVVGVLTKKGKTLTDLAEVIDGHIKFEDE